MVTTTVAKSVDILIGLSDQALRTMDAINQECLKKQLPPAFSMEEGVPKGNKHYRFEGLGVILGLPPRLSFWVHYKPDSPEHVNLGRFTMPLVSNGGSP